MDIRRVLRIFQERMRKYGLWAHVRGVAFSWRFARHGIIVVTGPGPNPRVVNRGGALIAENCQFYSGIRFEIGTGAEVRIGNGTYINYSSVIVAEKSVTIGRDCQIAWDVVIMDSDLHPVPGKGKEDLPVVIEDRVWIGCRSIILKGVRIGRGAIIAAGSVVTKDVPPFSIAAGVPARVIRTRQDEEARKEQLDPSGIG